MNYDAIIVGSGQAGVPLAFDLASAGWKVALVEEGYLGGTCVNTGCTPTKTLIHRAQVAHYARNSRRWGIETSNVRVRFDEVQAQVNKMVTSPRNSIERNIEKHPTLALIRGKARFTGPRRLSVGDREIEGEKIFINTGTRTAIPSIEGLDSVPYLTTDNIFYLASLPKHLIVLGGGYVGLELGQAFRRLGSEVTILHRSGQILPREDPEIAEELQKALESEGIRFVLNAQVRQVSGNVTVNGIEGSHLLIATGRQPNSDLDLDKAGIETDEAGNIKVDKKLQTTAEGVWALGDVKGGPAFTHISYDDYLIVRDNVLHGQDRSTEGRTVPYCVFTDPQLGGVGMTEKEALKLGYKLKIGKAPMSRVARAAEMDETAGSMKIVVNADNDQILGATILGAQGGEIVQILATTMRASVPYTLLKGAIFIHPTLAEGLYYLIEDVKERSL